MIVFLSLKIDFVLANSANPDEMSCGISFGSILFAKVPIQGLPFFKGLENKYESQLLCIVRPWLNLACSAIETSQNICMLHRFR